MNVVRHGITTHLRADAGVGALVADRVYHVLGPEDATLPYVTIQQMTENDVLAFGVTVAARRTTWQVKALSNSLQDAEAIDEACEAALQNAALDVSPKRLLACYRVSGIHYPERDGGQTLWHVGGIYAIDVQ